MLYLFLYVLMLYFERHYLETLFNYQILFGVEGGAPPPICSKKGLIAMFQMPSLNSAAWLSIKALSILMWKI